MWKNIYQAVSGQRMISFGFCIFVLINTHGMDEQRLLITVK